MIRQASVQVATPIQTKRIRLFGIDIDPLTMGEAVSYISALLAKPQQSCHFVVTPNVDHLVQLQSHSGLQLAYQQASLVVVDGKPVMWAANLLGQSVPNTVPGSDLVPAIFDDAQSKNTRVKVYLLGAMPGVADRAKDEIHRQWPMVEVVGTLSPPLGFDKDEAVSQSVCKNVNDSGAALLLIGLGAPKQELWITKNAPYLTVNVALCIGATIDFLAGEKARAPMWMRKVGLEWLHRVLTEPKRLARRYLIDAIVFPQLVFKEWLARR